MSAIGTMHIIWAVPTTLFIVFSFYTGLKPGATILFEPMALKEGSANISNTQGFKPIAIVAVFYRIFVKKFK
jgi:hypothetical protein